MSPRSRFFAVVVLVLVWMLNGRSSSAQSSSTPAERAHWVALTHKLEGDPFDDDANSEAEDVMRRLVIVDDITVPICGTLFDELADRSYKYGSKIGRQYMLASAAFLIEHPDRLHDENAMNLAGTESALKIYEVIAKQKPDERSKKLDDLLKVRNEGALAENIQKVCAAQ